MKSPKLAFLYVMDFRFLIILQTKDTKIVEKKDNGINM